MEDEYGLLIYEASAGSGKTYSLTARYLEYLAQDPQNAYKRVLAVTFTNKATAEMKSRIVKTLAQKAAPGADPAPFKTREQAQYCLSALLQDYTRFHVMTIDQFFQQILRNFIRELGINQAFDVELDQNVVLEYAVDALLKSLDTDSNLFGWIEDYLRDEEQDVPNIRAELAELGQLLFDERMLPWLSELTLKTADKEILMEQKKKLQQQLHGLKNEFETRRDEIAAELRAVLPNVSWWQAGSVNTFEKMNFGTEVKNRLAAMAVEGNDSWILKAYKAQVMAAWNPDCTRRLSQFFEWKSEKLKDFNTIKALLDNFSSFVVLTDLNRFCQQYQKENRLMLLDSCARLVNDLVKDCDAPYIYERVGVRLEHYLLDEFQDTSDVQWNNFRPLLDQACAMGFKNLVVGDVKQSIYRWRNSNWQLLAGLGDSCSGWGVKKRVLDTNWRSCPTIVQFNNQLFDAAEGLPKTLQGAFELKYGQSPEGLDVQVLYRESEQRLPPGSDSDSGRVQLRFVEKDEQACLDQMIEDMEKLHAEGYAWGQMAVLVRKGSQALAVAKLLLDRGISVLSNEALALKNSPAVLFLVRLLYAFAYPDEAYVRWLEDRYPDFAAKREDVYSQVFGKPLFEAVERLVQLFGLSDNASQVAYLQVFQDKINRFGEKGGNDYKGFVQWWVQYGSEQCIVFPGSADAVTIMTIHKSKGLDFGVVFVPYCDWDLGVKANSVLLCDPHSWLDLPVMPIKAGESLVDSHFKQTYVTEQYKTYIDNLNILYVAFTRPRYGLFAYGTDSGIGSLLKDRCSLLEEGVWGYECGRLPQAPAVEKTSAEGGYATYPVELRDLRLRLHNRNEESARGWGSKLHAVLEFVNRPDDLPAVLDKQVREGKLTKQERDKANVELQQMLALPEVRAWFDGSMEAKAEVPILDKSGTWRPDRVLIAGRKALVVDYKFGEPKPSYTGQVRRYMSLLSAMGYADVRGAIYYHLERRVEPVS